VCHEQVLPKDSKRGPLLRSTLAIQGLHSTQKHGDVKAPHTRPFTHLLPAYVSALRAQLREAGLEGAAMLSLGSALGDAGVGPEHEPETLLLPSRLLLSTDPSRSTIMVFFNITPARSGDSDASLPRPSPRAACSSSASIFMMLRDAQSASSDARQLTVVAAGAARDAAFLTSKHMALLGDKGTQVSRPRASSSPSSCARVCVELKSHGIMLVMLPCR
jgi:hypothetical protein